MNLKDHLTARLTAFGYTCTPVSNGIDVSNSEGTVNYAINSEIEEAFQKYVHLKHKLFDQDSWIMHYNKSIEYKLIMHNQDYYTDPYAEYLDAKNNSVNINRASIMFMFGHMDSDHYKEQFNRYFKWQKRYKSFEIQSTFWSAVTATFTTKARSLPADIDIISQKTINATLLKHAIEKNICYSIHKYIPDFGEKYVVDSTVSDLIIPKVEFDPVCSNFYKVAKSSPYPSQSFLSYYHIVEYYFLRISEDNLHNQLKSMLNQTNFSCNQDGLDRVISLVRGQDSKNDETELFRIVVNKFVPELHLIDFINSFESKYGKLYSKNVQFLANN